MSLECFARTGAGVLVEYMQFEENLLYITLWNACFIHYPELLCSTYIRYLVCIQICTLLVPHLKYLLNGYLVLKWTEICPYLIRNGRKSQSVFRPYLIRNGRKSQSVFCLKSVSFSDVLHAKFTRVLQTKYFVCNRRVTDVQCLLGLVDLTCGSCCSLHMIFSIPYLYFFTFLKP